MNESTEFINRENEIALVEQLLGEWGTLRILCIGGEGGIGKTRLLERVREVYLQERQRRAKTLITTRIDFDDPALHVSETLGRRIVSELGEEHFVPYIEALLDRRRMEVAGVSPARLVEEGERVDRAFVECFGKVAEARRVVLLLDTIEQVQGTDTLPYLLRLARQLPNTLIILAGREADRLGKELALRMGTEAVHSVRLNPLETTDAAEYLKRKQAQLHIALDPDLVERILALAGGRPLLIDLTADWIARKVPLPWLSEKSPDELKALSPDQQAEFEKALVSSIGELRTPRDRLLWIMALVWPLDKTMATRLTNWPSTQVDEAWQDVSSLSFVKRMPEDRLMLHDVVREMILQRLRPEIEVEREHRWFSDALSYLDELRHALEDQLRNLEGAERGARECGDDRKAWTLFMAQETIERALWTIDGQYLGYLLLLDPQEGLTAFEDAWQKATKKYRLSYRAVLISQIQRFRDRLLLSPAQKYQIDLRRSQHLLDSAMYEQSEQLLLEMLGKFGGDPHLKVELLIQLGNVVIRLGRFSDGLSHFLKAEQTSRQHALSQSLVLALNALGWVCRLMGRIEDAASHYREALKLSLDLGDEWRQAWLTNNLGYVYALQRNRDTALRLCKQALDLWKKIDFGRGVGAAYSTLGEISVEFNELDNAVEYFGQALNIFEPVRDLEWLSTTYCGRGAAFWLKGELDKARQDLEKAHDIGLKRDRPIVLHRLAHVYLEQRNIEGAKNLFKQSYQMSQSAPDPFYELNSLGDLARIAVLEGDVDRRGDFAARFLDFQERHKGIRYRLPEGLLHRYLGDLHLCAGEIEQAVDYYKKGLPLIAQAGSYEPYTITGQLADMEAIVLPRVDSKVVTGLAQCLEHYWTDEGYDKACPEALPFFARWKARTAQKGEGLGE